MAKPSSQATKPPSKYAQAFLESYNTIGLAGVLALSVATLNPLPLLAGIVLETAYMLVVPDSKWFANRLSARYDAEVTKRREELKKQILPQLREAMKNRFTRLEGTRQLMNDQTQDGKQWFREVLRKMDYLLEKFLLFASKENQFRQYLRSIWQEALNEKGSRLGQGQGSVKTVRSVGDYKLSVEPPLDPADDWVKALVSQVQSFYDAELAEVVATMQKDADDLETNAVLDKRRDVLQRRRDYVEQIGKILVNLNHQLQLMEDTFGLINDEIRARSPEQVLADIDDVVWKADALTDLLEDVAPANQMPASVQVSA